MAITYRKHFSGQTKHYWPDDTEKMFYIEESASLSDIIERCMDKWGKDFDMNKIEISPEHIHTDCIGYDLYDSGDYTNFLCIIYNE